MRRVHLWREFNGKVHHLGPETQMFEQRVWNVVENTKGMVPHGKTNENEAPQLGPQTLVSGSHSTMQFHGWLMLVQAQLFTVVVRTNFILLNKDIR